MKELTRLGKFLVVVLIVAGIGIPVWIYTATTTPTTTPPTTTPPTTTPPTTVPTPVLHSISPSTSTTGIITLTWEPISAITEMRVYRSTSSFTSVAQATRVKTLTTPVPTTCTDTITTNGKYFYRIAAVVGGVTSALSANTEIQVTVAIAAAPTPAPLPIIRYNMSILNAWQSGSNGGQTASTVDGYATHYITTNNRIVPKLFYQQYYIYATTPQNPSYTLTDVNGNPMTSYTNENLFDSPPFNYYNKTKVIDKKYYLNVKTKINTIAAGQSTTTLKLDRIESADGTTINWWNSRRCTSSELKFSALGSYDYGVTQYSPDHCKIAIFYGDTTRPFNYCYPPSATAQPTSGFVLYSNMVDLNGGVAWGAPWITETITQAEYLTGSNSFSSSYWGKDQASSKYFQLFFGTQTQGWFDHVYLEIDQISIKNTQVEKANMNWVVTQDLSYVIPSGYKITDAKLMINMLKPNGVALKQKQTNTVSTQELISAGQVVASGANTYNLNTQMITSAGNNLCLLLTSGVDYGMIQDFPLTTINDLGVTLSDVKILLTFGPA